MSLRFPCLVIKVNGKRQQANLIRTTNDPVTSRRKVWFTPPGKEQ